MMPSEGRWRVVHMTNVRLTRSTTYPALIGFARVTSRPAAGQYPGRVTAAFFDLDKTVIAKASMLAFGKPLHRAGYLSRWLVLRALWGQLVYRYLGADERRMAKMRTAALRIIVGWEQDRIRTLVRETLTEVIEPIVYAEAVERIRFHQSQGDLVFIVSASPEEIVEPMARFLGVDDHIATQPDLDAHGRYTGEVAYYAYGPAKAEAMAEIADDLGIDLADCHAYSDSVTDIPMLAAVGHAHAVNPDRELRRAATQRGWEILRFEAPVSLRTGRPTPAQTAAIGGGAAAVVGAGAAAWWYTQRRARRHRSWLRQATGWAR